MDNLNNNFSKSVSDYFSKLTNAGHTVQDIKKHDRGFTFNVRQSADSSINKVQTPENHTIFTKFSMTLNADNNKTTIGTVYLINNDNTIPTQPGSVA